MRPPNPLLDLARECVRFRQRSVCMHTECEKHDETDIRVNEPYIARLVSCNVEYHTKYRIHCSG